MDSKIISKPSRHSPKDTLMHYARRLQEKYPQYTIKEIYFFLKTSFKFIRKTISAVDENTEDTNIQLGNFVTLRFRNQRYRNYKSMKAEQKWIREQKRLQKD